MTEKLGNGKRSRKSYEMYVHVLNSADFRNYVKCMDVSTVRIFVSFFCYCVDGMNVFKRSDATAQRLRTSD